MGRTRTVREIRQRLERGDAIVMTASELCDAVRSGERVSMDDVDVVTCATKGLMSGTMAVLSFQVAPRANAFLRASEVSMNGVPCHPGPCPNERLGVLDVVVHGTQRSALDPNYGGGHLFRDLVEGRDIPVEVRTAEGQMLESTITLDDVPHAKMHGTRQAFMNYMAFVNPGEAAVDSIFSVKALKGSMEEASVCGCGEINPLQKDPELELLGVGSPVLLNGAEGIILGSGTRASRDKPNLSTVADMHAMDPGYMGGFRTAQGPEVISSVAAAIPIVSERALEHACVVDNKVPLIVADVSGREQISRTTYADVWQGTDLSVAYDAEGCSGFRSNCPDCPPEALCPTGAFALEREGINRGLCFNCGACKVNCRGQAFRCELGAIDVKGKKVPIVLRQSDRLGAQRLAADLKERVLRGAFQLGEPVRRIEL